MGNAAIELGVRLESVSCGKCGGVYALSAKYIHEKRQQGGYWRCPYCEVPWGYGESQVDRLKEKLEREKKRRKWAESNRDRARKRAEREARRAAGYKGAFRKAKKRVGKGVCPCCNRHFTDLQRHMETKHPEYAVSEPQVLRVDICGAETTDGTPCERKVAGGKETCWQH